MRSYSDELGKYYYICFYYLMSLVIFYLLDNLMAQKLVLSSYDVNMKSVGVAAGKSAK